MARAANQGPRPLRAPLACFTLSHRSRCASQTRAQSPAGCRVLFQSQGRTMANGSRNSHIGLMK